MERSEVLVQLLGLVHAHDEEGDLFVVYPNKLGFGQIVAPISGGDENVASKLNLLLQLPWPAGTLMQLSLYTSPDLVGITTAYGALRADVREPLLRAMTVQHIDFLKTGAFTPIDQKTNIRLRDTRIAITVQIPFKGAAPSEVDLRNARELRVGFDQALASAGIQGAPITPKRYIRLMETILNQGQDAAWKKSPITTYDENELICTQVIDPGNAVDVDENGLWLNGSTRVNVLSPKRYPDMVYFGMAARYLIDPKQGARGIRENTLITLNVHFPDQEPTRNKTERDHMWSTQQSGTPLAKYVRYYRDRLASLNAILDQVNKGDRIVEAYLSMAIFTQGEGDSPEQRKRTEERSVAAVINAQSYWREFGFQMMQDKYLVQPMFSQLLPFAGDTALRTTLERYKRMSGRHATYLMPVFGQWRGTGTPLFTLIARDGQVQPISPWDTDGNMNFMVCAASGSGKSVLCQYVTDNMLSIGGRAWIIDVGDSYKNLCETSGGQYIEFGKGTTICINPFTLVKDFDEEVDMLAGLVAVMIAPKEGLDDFRMPALKRAMKEVWDAHQTGMTVDLLAEHLLRAERQEIRDMGEQIYPFTSAGAYGRYFAGRNTVNVNNRLTVLELGALKSMAHLQRVVLLSLMYQIGQAVYMGDRTQKSMLLVDEAWQLLATDETAEFIERAYRQFRKHEASVGIITQSVMDVWQNKGGRAIAENSAHMYLLKQKGDSIDAVKRESRLPFGDWGYDMLKTVHTVQGEYSEIMCVTPYGIGIGRLVLNGFQKVLYSTSGDVTAAIKRLRAQGLSLEDAAAQVAAEKYGQQARAATPFKKAS